MSGLNVYNALYKETTMKKAILTLAVLLTGIGIGYAADEAKVKFPYLPAAWSEKADITKLELAAMRTSFNTADNRRKPLASASNGAVGLYEVAAMKVEPRPQGVYVRIDLITKPGVKPNRSHGPVTTMQAVSYDYWQRNGEFAGLTTAERETFQRDYCQEVFVDGQVALRIARKDGEKPVQEWLGDFVVADKPKK